MVADGPIVTKYEMRVVDSFLGVGVESAGSRDGDGDLDRLEGVGGAPIMAFSLIMQPSPITMGPSKA